MCASGIVFSMDTKHSPEPKTLQEAIVYFSDADRCFEFAKKLRWPDGNVVCPRCGAAKNSFVKTRRLWFCYACKKQFTIKVKTIMEDSPITLDKWMTAFWLLANAKNGISSHELGRALGVTQTTAWFMLQRIREVLNKTRKFGDTTKLGGPDSQVEVDETFVGGKVKNMHRSRRTRFAIEEGYVGASTGKTIVQGILDRNLRQVRAQVVPNVKRETLQNEILKNVKYGSKVYTDTAVGYETRLNWHFVHDMVNKTEAYVKGQVHVNGMENFWSLLKRSLSGTYVAVEPFHLARYVDEQVFRYNNRATKEHPKNDAYRFKLAMSQVVGRRLTYDDLTGKSESPHHAPTGTGTEVQEPF
jgi:transposase-like protein